MDFTQLQYFRTVARLQNVTRAAEVLYISQPNLSTALTKLENEVGIPLFYRKKGSITLTPKGEIFLAHVDRAMQELDNAMSIINAHSTVVSRRTDVASSISGLLPRLIKAFSGSQEPEPFIHLLMDSEELYRLLMESRLDFVITTVPGNGIDIQWIPLCEDSIVAIVAKDHPLAKYNSIPLDPLSRERIVCNNMFLEKDSIDEMCIKAGFFPNIYIHGNEFIPGISKIIPLQGAVTLALSHTLPQIRTVSDWDNFHVVPLTGPFSTVSIGIARKKSRLMTESASKFYDYTVKHLPGIIAETSLNK